MSARYALGVFSRSAIELAVSMVDGLLVSLVVDHPEPALLAVRSTSLL